MKMTRLSFVFSLAAAVAFTVGGASRVLADQPLMNRAIDQLEMAKKGEHKEHLEKAKHILEDAAHDKGGERKEAIHHIDEALEALRHDEHKRMQERIDEAIHSVREGKHDAR